MGNLSIEESGNATRRLDITTQNMLASKAMEMGHGVMFDPIEHWFEFKTIALFMSRDVKTLRSKYTGGFQDLAHPDGAFYRISDIGQRIIDYAKEKKSAQSN